MARIGIDLDGVCYDFNAAFKHYLIVERRFKPETVATPPTRWRFYREWGISDDEFVRHCHAGVNSGVIFLWGDPIGDVACQLQRLRDAGHTIHIITDRTFGTNNRSQSNTYAWLTRHGIPYDTVTFTADKTSVNVDYMIDDKPENYMALEAAGVGAVLCSRPWNRGVPAWRVDELSEFVDYVILNAATPAPPVDVDAPIDLWPVSDTGEVRSVSSTGGEKGVKPAQFEFLPSHPLFVIAEHFAKGAEKYSAHNWRRGYEWSKSFGALQRHLWAWWGGEDIDAETGSSHLAAAGFHVLALIQFMQDYPEFDDRYKPPTPSDDGEPGAVTTIGLSNGVTLRVVSQESPEDTGREVAARLQSWHNSEHTG